MARSLLGSLVSGTRQMLTAQLFISIAAIGVAGWTLGVTNELIRERDTLNERVIQLEQELAGRGIVPPASTPEPATQPAATPNDYPPPKPTPETTPTDQTPPPDPGTPNPGRTRFSDAARVRDGAVVAADPQPAPSEEQTGVILRQAPQQNVETRTFNPAQIFAAAPRIATIVLHVRTQADLPLAQRLAEELGSANEAQAVVGIMSPNDARASGYAYFDGRQSRAAAALVQQFTDLARRNQIALWAVRLPGTALPAQGEYTADRLDIVLPSLQQPTLR